MEPIQSKSVKEVLRITKCGENIDLVKIGEKGTTGRKVTEFLAPYRGHDRSHCGRNTSHHGRNWLFFRVFFMYSDAF